MTNICDDFCQTCKKPIYLCDNSDNFFVSMLEKYNNNKHLFVKKIFLEEKNVCKVAE